MDDRPDASFTTTPVRRGLAPRALFGSRLGRVLAMLTTVGMLLMWGYVLYLAFGPGRQPPVDRLDDPAFAQAAEVRCADALSGVEQLPLATESESAAERADVVNEANEIYRVMLDDLDGLAALAPDGDQRERVDQWLVDWRIHLGDRQEYVDRLRVDPTARLLISEKPGEGRHITGWIDEFALANNMPSCAAPTDA
jgi:hypothetical protein